jgi:hypothetical protein
MIKRTILALTVLISVASFPIAQEKKDATAVNPIVIIQQASSKPLAKQSVIRPKPQSNWSKIKDLFM